MRIKPWEFRLLLLVAVSGTMAMMFIPNVPPAAAAGIGGLLTWVLSNLKIDKADNDEDEKPSKKSRVTKRSTGKHRGGGGRDDMAH